MYNNNEWDENILKTLITWIILPTGNLSYTISSNLVINNNSSSAIGVLQNQTLYINLNVL